MRIVIAGGSGFLGTALVNALRRAGHHLVILSRQARRPAADQPSADAVVVWSPDGTSGPWASAIDGADVVINLAGESIAAGRWNDARKRRILESRVNATQSLAKAITTVAAPPALLISGSAVGYYGASDDHILTESAPAGRDFLATVCVRWEEEALRAAGRRTRVVCVRTGLVLDPKEGALPRMLLPFRLGLGGPLGSGRQYWPWIHRQDWVDLIAFLVQVPDAHGAVNATAPVPVSNAEFSRALGRALHRPAVLPAPAFALRLALGEMADALLLSGQRAVPAHAERLGFQFTYRDIEPALRQLLA